MKKAHIRRAVRRAFTAAGDVVVAAQLVRKTASDYIPGMADPEMLSPVVVRFLATEKPLSARNNAVDPLLEAGVRYGLLECAEITPRADDDLNIGTAHFTLIQVVPADLGAGLLFEVMYQ